jgi:hypothetical protein
MNIIVTHFHPMARIFKQMADLSKKHNAEMAKKMGWGFEYDDNRSVPDLSIYRERSNWICDVMSRHKTGDNILWLDADCLVVGKHTEDIFAEKQDADVGLVKYYMGRWNCGVMAFSITPTIRSLFDEIVRHKHGELGDDNWTENQCANCPMAPAARGPLCGSSSVVLAELSKKWNSPSYEPDTEILGYHIMDGYTKYKRIIDALEKYKLENS